MDVALTVDRQLVPQVVDNHVEHVRPLRPPEHECGVEQQQHVHRSATPPPCTRRRVYVSIETGGRGRGRDGRRWLAVRPAVADMVVCRVVWSTKIDSIRIHISIRCNNALVC